MMMTSLQTRSLRAFLLLILLTISAPVSATQDRGGDPSSDATPRAPAELDKALRVPIESLKVTLLPLRRAELEHVVETWINRVEAKIQELTAKQIEARGATGETKISLQQDVATLSEEKTALITRATVVVAAYETKGGDAEEYQQYLRAVAGVDIDVTDASALWAYVQTWLVSPDGGIRILMNILKFIGMLFITWIVARIIAGIVRRAVKRLKNTSELLQNFLISMTRKLVWVVGFVIALSMLEFNIGPLIAAIGAAGLVVGLALQGTLSNFASGLLILIYRPFDVGDWVQIAGQGGTVDSMTVVTTTLITSDNKRVVIPNNQVWGNVIENVTGRPTRRIDMVFGIGYTDDIDRARDVLTEIVTSHELVLDDPEPTIQLHELADSSVNFIVRPWSKTSDYWAVYWDVHMQVKKRFDAEGIGIPYPQMDVHVHQVTSDE